MARAPSKPAAPAGRSVQKRSENASAVVDYEKRLEQEAEKAKELEKSNGLGGKSFSFKGGVLSFDGAAIKGNKVPVIVLASAFEKAYYEGRYDPNSPEPPVCFALTTEDPENMAPNPDDVADLKSDSCVDCPFNQWGSADTGRGKACKDIRRVAMIPAGVIEKSGDVTLIDDPKVVEKAEIGFAKLPPTSLNSWQGFVRATSETLKRPPHGVFTMLELEPHATNQFTVVFEALDLIDKKLLGAVFKRHDLAVEDVMRPYTYPTEEQKKQRAQQNKAGGRGKPAATRGRGNTKPAASGGRSRKY